MLFKVISGNAWGVTLAGKATFFRSVNMKLLTPILLGAALIVGCAAPALAAPQSYQDDQSRQANTQAYTAGYSQGQADARANATRNNQPGAQWTSNADQLAYTPGV